MDKHVIDIGCSLYQALWQMNSNHVKFLVATEPNGQMTGTLTDGDVRRAILKGVSLHEQIGSALCKRFTYVDLSAGLEQVMDAFREPRIEFLPVLDGEGKLRNLITRKGLNSLLLQNQKFEIDFDFRTIDENTADYEILARPWGFYKTTVLNKMFQSKIIHIMPGQSLSLQSHQHREEYWIVINGTGVIQLGESIHTVIPGQSYFIPKGCKHRMSNISETETLIMTEVQMGDYFGEDDIYRYEDNYGRE